MIRVLIADDHHVVRRGLLFFLKTQKDFEVVGEAANGKEAVALTAELQPDIVLMDLVMPEMDGIQATKKIKAQFPAVHVLMLTSFSDRDHVVPAIEAGAAGYQLKDIEPDELVETIRKIIAGENILHPDASEQLEEAEKEERDAPDFLSLEAGKTAEALLQENTKAFLFQKAHGRQAPGFQKLF